MPLLPEYKYIGKIVNSITHSLSKHKVENNDVAVEPVKYDITDFNNNNNDHNIIPI
ncbi:hypothetical protein [Anaerofustis butyriciformans]|uniref:hypothetical protein n=1 Tax=Anaerofustis TaxID=264995 RepID=UPI003F8A5B32